MKARTANAPAPDAAKNAATEALEKELLEAAPTTPEA
jgi:small subunit ribosomal protein S2